MPCGFVWLATGRLPTKEKAPTLERAVEAERFYMSNHHSKSIGVLDSSADAIYKALSHVDTTAPQDWLTNDDAPISQREAARIAGISESGLRARIRTGKVSKPDNYTEKWALDLKAMLEQEKVAKADTDTGLLFDDTKENAPTASEGAEVTQPDNSDHSNTVSHATGSAWPMFSLFAHTSTTTAERAITYPELVAMAANPVNIEKGKAKAFITSNATGKTGEAVNAPDIGFAVAVIDIDNSTALDEIESGLQEIGIGRALIYATKTATPTIKKWRVVVPFSEPLDHDTWHSITGLLCERFAGDNAMLRPTQVSYVPNEGSFYHHQELTTGEPLHLNHPVITHAIEREQERLIEFEREKAAMAKAYANESKRAQPQSLANGKSPIDAFNAQFSIESLLDQHGYKRHRGKKYRCPNSTSGVAGVVILDDPTTGLERVYSHHSPDSDPLANGFAHDAFSVFTVLEHGGDSNAALIAAGEITGVTKANQEAYRQQLHQQHLEREKQERLNGFAQVQDVSQAMGQQGHGEATEIAPIRLESLILDLNIPTGSDDCGWALANWLPFGEVTLLAGHGGSGKSYVALVLAVHVALGLPFGGVETTQSRVLFVSCEDSGRIVKQRLSRIADGMMESLANVGQSLDILDLSDIDATLYVANSYDKTCQATVRTAELMQLVKSRNYGLIIVDNASETFGGNEINRQEVRGFVRMLRTGLADISSSVLLLAHINKISATNGGKEDYSGSTAWHNSVRSRISLGQGTIKDQLLLTHQKSNYGKLQEPIALMWNGPCPLPITSEQTRKAINENNNKKREWLLDAMRQIESEGSYLNGSLTGQSSLRSQLKKIDGCPFGGQKGDGKEIESILEELEASGKIEKVYKHGKANGVWQLIPDQSDFDDLLG